MQISLTAAAATPTMQAAMPQAPKTVEDPHSGLHPALLALLLIGLAWYWWLVTWHRSYWQTLITQQKKADVPRETQSGTSSETTAEAPAPKAETEVANTTE
jgi:hypothetical protein